MSSHVGIDVGAYHLFGAAIDIGSEMPRITFCPDTKPDAVVDWCASRKPESVAIDGPPAHSRNIAKIGRRRLAEERLGIGGCYSTPRVGTTPLPPWMAMGMRCHSRINAAIGETTLSLGGTGTVFEVHPTYAFRSLLGVVDDGERVRCDPERLLRPKAPRRSIGHLQRVEILRTLLEDLGIAWTPEISEILLSRLDWTDAAISGVIGVLRARNGTLGIGDAREGTIVIADPSKLGALARRICDAASSSSISDRQAALRKRVHANSRTHDIDCAVLRLGSRGVGSFSQQETISALCGQLEEDQIILPVGLRSVGRAWVERAASAGFWLLVAHERLDLAVHVVQVIGTGRRKPTRKDRVVAVNRDPWPTVEQSEYWFLCDGLIDNLNLPMTSVSTRQDGCWTPGMPRNQTAWLAARIDDEQLRERLQLAALSRRAANV